MARTATSLNPVRGIAWTAGGIFATFYIFYASAPVTFAHTSPGAGARVAVVMLIAVAVQPLFLIAGRWSSNRRHIVLIGVTSMGLGSAVMPFTGHWPGQILFGLGFGVFVVSSTAWVKDVAPPGRLGRAFGIYGFGAVAGGALGAPAGPFLADQLGATGPAAVGAAIALTAMIPAARVRRVSPSDGSSLNAAPRNTGPATPLRRAEAPPIGCAAASVALAVHLLASTIYAGTLSAVAGLQGHHTWLIAASALAIQVSLGAGRLAGGAVTDWRSPAYAVHPGLVLLAISAMVFTIGTNQLLILGSSALVGFAAGMIQTAALATAMRRAHSTAGANRASAAWNICFDIGLGIGGLASGHMLRL